MTAQNVCSEIDKIYKLQKECINPNLSIKQLSIDLLIIIISLIITTIIVKYTYDIITKKPQKTNEEEDSKEFIMSYKNALIFVTVYVLIRQAFVVLGKRSLDFASNLGKYVYIFFKDLFSKKK